MKITIVDNMKWKKVFLITYLSLLLSLVNLAVLTAQIEENSITSNDTKEWIFDMQLQSGETKSIHVTGIDTIGIKIRVYESEEARQNYENSENFFNKFDIRVEDTNFVSSKGSWWIYFYGKEKFSVVTVDFTLYSDDTVDFVIEVVSSGLSMYLDANISRSLNDDQFVGESPHYCCSDYGSTNKLGAGAILDLYILNYGNNALNLTIYSILGESGSNLLFNDYVLVPAEEMVVKHIEYPTSKIYPNGSWSWVAELTVTANTSGTVGIYAIIEFPGYENPQYTPTPLAIYPILIGMIYFAISRRKNRSNRS